MTGCRTYLRILLPCLNSVTLTALSSRSSIASCLVNGTILFWVASASATVIQSVSHAPGTVGRYEKLEITFGLSTVYNNPFDPDQVDARVRFTSPTGKIQTVVAFWIGSVYPTQPTPEWKARFAPSEQGAYSYTILVTDAQGQVSAGPYGFAAGASTRKGFVRSDPLHPNGMRHETGEAYHPIGHNVAWPEGGGVNDYIRWFDKFRANGCNTGRIWMTPYVGQGLEWYDDGRGEYHGVGRYSMSNAARIDQIVAAAEARGIHLMMCTFSFNELSLSDFSNWGANPYRDIFGGPINTPTQFFTNAQCRASIKKLLRYVVARWGYSTSVLCWQLFNEFDAITRNDFETPGAWHSEMAAHIKSLDPFGHPVTSSMTNQNAGGLRSPTFWQRPELDWIVEHRYHEDVPAAHLRLSDAGVLLRKPTLLGEAGTSPSNFGDPSGNHMRRIAWASSLRLSGSLYWWWQSIDAVNSYANYKPLAAFIDGEDWCAYGALLTDFTTSGGPPGTTCYGMQSPQRAYVFIMAPSNSPSVSGLVLRNVRLLSGNYRVEVWRTSGFQGMQSSFHVTATDHKVDVSVPNFANDTALKILPLAVEPTVTPISPAPTGSPTATPPFAQAVLLSQHKPAFASSVYGAGYGPEKANDGIANNTNSRWISSWEEPHWWYVDLQAVYALNRAVLYSELAAGGTAGFNVSGFNIRASPTGAGSLYNWDVIGSFDDPCGTPYPSYTALSTHVSGNYRYVCIEVTRNDGNCGAIVRVAEVQVFGNTPGPTATPTPAVKALIGAY